MFFKILLNYLVGYINIEIEGYYIERFINTCMKNDIFLWGIKRKRVTMLLSKIGADDLEKAKQIAEKHQCRITVKSQKGMPFLIEKYKKRKTFFIALLILAIALFTLSKFVWNIEINETQKIDSNEILQQVKESGLKIGKLKKSINVEEIVNKIRLERADIAWIGIELKGTNAIVKVVEAEEKPDIIDENDFSNIVASKDGEIVKAIAQNGTVMVEAGEQVKKGDILIAGWMEGKHTDKYYVNSNGSVKAKIKYSLTEKVEKNEIIKTPTGKTEKKYSIKFNDFRLNLYKKLSKFDKYETQSSSKKLTLFSNFYIPIEFIKTTNNELSETTKPHDYNEAKEIGEKLIDEKAKKLLTGEILDRNTEVNEFQDYYNIIITYDVIEEIGIKEKIK